MTGFYQRIEWLAERHEMKLTAFLTRCGIPKATFTASKHRGHEPHLKNIKRVLNAFPNVRVEWLAWGEGEPFVLAALPEKDDSEEVAALKRQVEQLKNLLLEKERRIIDLELKLASWT